jgi:NAD(P)-dependent dehydrogenase (short-subunit alcohol dehydrogenase family)/acyl carrier protein
VEPVAGAPAVTAPAGEDEIADRVLAIVAEQTGYPPEMLELDLNLEADLGVDTVKQAETFLGIRQAFDIPRQENLKLSDYPTLAHVIQFVREQRPDLAGHVEPAGETQSAIPAPALREEPVQASTTAADDITAKVLAIVAEQTGYPPEMLELDLNLEADLGVDTVKQAETFLSIRQAFDIPRQENLKLGDYPTLAHVIQFVRDHRADLPAPLAVEEAPVQEAAAAAGLSLEAANMVPRRVPIPSLRPALELCKPTGVTLDGNSRIVVMPDAGGVGKALVRRLESLGVTVFVPDEAGDGAALQRQLESWLEQGPIDGVYWLRALDEEPALAEMSLDDWHRENQIRVKNLYTTMRALYESVNRGGAFLVAGTRLGGLHGYGSQGASAPLGGGVSGFAKAYRREQPEVLVKVVDFPASRKTTALADALIAETLYDPAVVEVGYPGAQVDERVTITLVEQPAGTGEGGLPLNTDTVFLVTGAAGGITSAIVADLAAHSGGAFYLLDLIEAPAAGDEQIALFRQDKAALKQRLIEQATAAGERPTPVLIERQLLAVERREAALRAVEAVTVAGGTAHYHSVNLLDAEAVAAVIEEIRQKEGRIDVLIHAAGVEISKPLPKKEPAEFDLVFGVKADGLFNLFKASADLPLGAVVVFSSVAGRFGNGGQTDYSAANDLLCKLVSSLRRGRSRGIAIDWTAWAGIGMATRGSIPKIMEMAGIEMLAPEAGVPTVRRELVSGPFSGEIVVAGRLGMLAEARDESGGLDAEKANAWLRAQNPPFLMVGELQAAHLDGGLEATTVLDPREQPFLYDHALDGTPLLPGVMVTETFAQLAQVLAPGYRVVAVEDETFFSPFKFYRMEPQSLYLQALGVPAGDELLVHTALRSRRQLAGQEALQEKLHFTATVRLSRDGSEAGTTPAGETIALLGAEEPELGAPETGRDAIYNIYFHGPAYQVLEGVQVAGQRAVGLMARDLPPDTCPPEAASLMAPRLIELCFQTAGIWQIRTSGVLALPASLDSVSAARAIPAGDDRRLWAVVEAAGDGESFNAQVVDDDGAVYLQLRGYRTVALPGKVELG